MELLTPPVDTVFKITGDNSLLFVKQKLKMSLQVTNSRFSDLIVHLDIELHFAKGILPRLLLLRVGCYLERSFSTNIGLLFVQERYVPKAV